MGIYEKIISDNQKFIDEIWDRIVSKMDVASERNRNKLPFIQTDGAYDDMAQNYPEAWTNGFWPGMMWLLYVGTQNEKYKEIARCGAEFLEKCADDFDLLHHDVGFMWNISTGADWRITGDKKAKSRTMYMAASLASRYNMNTGCIRAWAEEARESMVIIDSMMNISLLYLASKETNDPRFSLVAQAHADTCAKNHIRPDGSVYHILEYDIRTGELIGVGKGQGCDFEENAWSRGTAWALYGYAISALHTGKKEYLDIAKKVANFFVVNTAESGYIPKYDFRQPIESDAIDTSAGCIAACGLIELAKLLPECEKGMYLNSALKIIKAICEKYCDFASDTDAIVGGVAISPACLNQACVFGDYYFIEAIYKLKGFDPMFW